MFCLLSSLFHFLGSVQPYNLFQFCERAYLWSDVVVVIGALVRSRFSHKLSCFCICISPRSTFPPSLISVQSFWIFFPMMYIITNNMKNNLHKVTLSQFFSIVQYQVSNYIPCKTLKKTCSLIYTTFSSLTNKMVQFFIHNPIYSYVSCWIEKNITKTIHKSFIIIIISFW